MPCALQYALCEVCPRPDSGRVVPARRTRSLTCLCSVPRATPPELSISSLPHPTGRGPSHIT